MPLTSMLFKPPHVVSQTDFTSDSERYTFGTNFLAGAISGAASTVVCCPLEVIKTRMQSDAYVNQFKQIPSVTNHRIKFEPFLQQASRYHANVFYSGVGQVSNSIRLVIQTEGRRGLFKGLLPALVGIVPSRAIFFSVYEWCKQCNGDCSNALSHSTVVLSSLTAGICQITITSPIYVMKTRMQLNKGKDSLIHCILRTLKKDGVRGFYKGISASYLGTAETMLHFTIYEYLKSVLRNNGSLSNDICMTNSVQFMGAAVFSRLCATLVAYPHEVLRTKMREENTRFVGLLSTIKAIFREEGRQGLYRGLSVELLRKVPNYAVLFAVYELVVAIAS